MNLFKEETLELLEKYVTKDWAEVLSDYIDAETFKGIRRQIGLARNTAIVYPESKDIFKALSYDFSKVKVVIVGQDPYHNGNADGLAFSCKNTLSPSLKLILQAIWKDEMRSNGDIGSSNAAINTMKNYINNKSNWNLEYLAQQGVLLYNPTLTVEAGKPQSHKGIWNEFTKAVIQSLSRRIDIIWMLWGNDAKEVITKSSVSEDYLARNNHLILKNEHPAAASYAQRTWECDHFTRSNKWLEENNLTKIEWIQR